MFTPLLTAASKCLGFGQSGNAYFLITSIFEAKSCHINIMNSTGAPKRLAEKMLHA
jgi:hypothetical protein